MGDLILTAGLPCICSFGGTPTTTSTNTTVMSQNKPVLTMNDMTLIPGGVCNLNPTAPVPCAPPSCTWLFPSMKATIKGSPIVLAKPGPVCKCALNGMISIVAAGTVTAT